jgi:hypothetical protein
VQGGWHEGWHTAPGEGRKHLYKFYSGIIII